MNSTLAKSLRILVSAVTVLLLLLGVGAGWFYLQMRASLPLLDGVANVAGLRRAVGVTRDVQGVPTIRGESRADVARALGFLHAQDRFFQMDLLRRRPAGELAELVGRAALPLDRLAKPHRFRRLAEEVLAAASVEHRGWIEAYAAGVNSGLAALRKKPFEYYLLRAEPQAWRTEDSVLVAYAMILDLQDELNQRELSLMTLRDQFGSEAVPFFAPTQTPDDAALDGSTREIPPVPGPKVLDLREQPPTAEASLAAAGAAWYAPWAFARDSEFLPGSNSFALTGVHTASKTALLGNDPHLNLAVPNIWYRTVMEWPLEKTADRRVRIVGVTIPGLPFAVLGSNGQVAWGMTTSFADTNDLVAVDVHPISRDLYRVAGRDELQQIEKRVEVIAVKEGTEESVESEWTVWGPIVGRDERDRPLAHRWVAHEPEATNLEFFALETAASVDEAVTIAHRAGIPAHNFQVADKAGAIGWTIAGKLPRRVGFDGRLPVSWSFGDRRWEGFLPAEEVPTIIVRSAETTSNGTDTTASPGMAPEPRAQAGRLWTANNRIVGGAALARVGDGGYMAPARAVQVRDGLVALERATPADLLRLQLDDRALFLERWRDLLLTTLDPAAVRAKESRAELRRLIEHWEGRASIDSVSYRLVREFRAATASLVFEAIFARCVAHNPQFNWRSFNYEQPLWALLQQRPPHLLARPFGSWDELLLAAVDRVTEQTEKQGLALERATWGERNTAAIRHPLSRSLPAVLARWLDLPADPLPGDSNLPRVQNPSFGASMRLAVSPGREEEGLFQMPGGQSGHPLSSFYRAGHAAWVKGEPAPLLPGPAVHTLTLMP